MRIVAVMAALVVASVASAQERPAAEPGETKKKQPEAWRRQLQLPTVRRRRSATGRSSARRLAAQANVRARLTRRSSCGVNPPPLRE